MTTTPTRDAAAQEIRTRRLIAIVRGTFPQDEVLRIGEALLAGGVTVLELTLNSPGALDALPRLREGFGNALLLGVGTVRHARHARAAIEAGADFLVSPGFDA